MLFNDTIMHNIRYGNLSASDEQVQEAARLACIHDTIVNRFPKVSRAGGSGSTWVAVKLMPYVLHGGRPAGRLAGTAAWLECPTV